VTLTINVYLHDCRPKHAMRLSSYGPVSEQPSFFGPPEMPMKAPLTNTQQVDFEYAPPVDKAGQPADVQAGSVKLKSSDVTVASVTQDPANPFKGLIKSVGKGACQITISADADLGDGDTEISGEPIDVTVTGGQAVGFGGVTVGTPVEQG